MTYTDNIRKFLNEIVRKGEIYNGKEDRKNLYGYYGRLADTCIKNGSYFGYEDENIPLSSIDKKKKSKLQMNVRKTLYNIAKPSDEKFGKSDEEIKQANKKYDNRKETRIRLDHLEGICKGFQVTPNDILLSEEVKTLIKQQDKISLLKDNDNDDPEEIGSTIILDNSTIHYFFTYDELTKIYKAFRIKKPENNFSLKIAHDLMTGISLELCRINTIPIEEKIKNLQEGTELQYFKFFISYPLYDVEHEYFVDYAPIEVKFDKNIFDCFEASVQRAQERYVDQVEIAFNNRKLKCPDFINIYYNSTFWEKEIHHSQLGLDYMIEQKFGMNA